MVGSTRRLTSHVLKNSDIMAAPQLPDVATGDSSIGEFSDPAARIIGNSLFNRILIQLPPYLQSEYYPERFTDLVPGSCLRER